MTHRTLEDDLPEPDEQPAVMSTWKPAERISYWAFRADRYEGYRRYGYTHLGSDADAEEATDNAFDSILGAWPRILGMEHLDRYAWTIVKRRIVDQRRKRHLRPEPTDISAFEAALNETTADPYDVLTGTIQFYTAVRRLSERQRDAVILYYGLDYSTRRTASILGIEEASVRSTLRQARNRLAQLLGVPTNASGDGKDRS
ncbi:RNA polymerase sigma factor [Streptomyces spororaveus]|uniref:RNA polymerase sigma factor n=1 Tax=Streptomyces TaxID=1883 RepID=UPI0036C5ED28